MHVVIHALIIIACYIIIICRNPLGVCVYEIPPTKYSAMRIMEILLDPSIGKEKVAYKRPIEVKSSSTFVIDITRLAHPEDVKKDAYGHWICTGSHTDVYRCSIDLNQQTHIEKAAPGATGTSVYTLRRLHFVHPSHKEFRRILAFVHGEYMLHACMFTCFNYYSVNTKSHKLIYVNSCSLQGNLQVACQSLRGKKHTV